MSGNALLVRWCRCWSILLLGMAVALVAGPVRAQVSNEKAAAEALFDQGVELLKAGKYGQACSKLESSQRIDSGIGTLLYLGDCYERLGRTASAWATFREAASKAEAAGETERARVGKQRADALEPRLAHVTIEMARENLSIKDLKVLESGKEMHRALWGTPVPVDPGQLKVVVDAPGYEPFEAMITVREATSNNSLEIPPLVARPQEDKSDAALGAAQPVTPQDDPGAGQTRRILGYVLGGVGVVGLGVGAGFGIAAITKNQKAKDSCPTVTTCEPGSDGVELTNQALDFATVSTVGVIAGGVLLATGVVLVVTAPKRGRTARIGLTPTAKGAHLSFGGSF